MKTLDIIVEKGNDGSYWGRIENDGHYMPVGVGDTIEEMKKDVALCIEDYMENEGPNDPFWKSIKPSETEFNLIPQSESEA